MEFKCRGINFDCRLTRGKVELINKIAEVNISSRKTSIVFMGENDFPKKQMCCRFIDLFAIAILFRRGRR